MTRSPNARLRHRMSTATDTVGGGRGRRCARSQAGAASAEYAAVTACGVGFAGVLLKLFTSDFGQSLLQKIVEMFFSMLGIG